MTEQVILVNEADEEIGFMEKMEAHEKALLHRAFSVFVFNSKGEWQSGECIIDFNNLPADVRDGFSKSKYASWEKTSVTELQSMGKPVQYRIVVQKGALQKKGLFFNADGVLQKELIKL